MSVDRFFVEVLVSCGVTVNEKIDNRFELEDVNVATTSIKKVIEYTAKDGVR